MLVRFEVMSSTTPSGQLAIVGLIDLLREQVHPLNLQQ